MPSRRLPVQTHKPPGYFTTSAEGPEAIKDVCTVAVIFFFNYCYSGRLTGLHLPSSCSFRVKFSQTLDFPFQTSHSNSKPSSSPPPPRVNVINRAVCSAHLCSLAHLFTHSLTVSFHLRTPKTQTHHPFCFPHNSPLAFFHRAFLPF